MVKTIHSLVLLIFFLTLSAQIHAQSLKFGIKGGLNSSWVSDDIADSESVRGVNVAAFTELQFSGRISLLLDAGLNQRGFERKQIERRFDGSVVGSVSARTRLNYLTLSPQLNVHFSKKHWRPYLGAGPRFDFLTGRKPGEFEFSEVTIVDETADAMENSVIGGVLAAGIKHGSQDAFQWKLELRFDRDFTDSLPDSPGLFRSNSLALLFGISF